MALTATVQSQKLVRELQVSNLMKSESTNRITNFSASAIHDEKRYETSNERLYKKLKAVIHNATKYTHKGCSIWRKSQLAAKLVCRRKMNRPFTRRQEIVAKVLAEDNSVEERLIVQALKLDPTPRGYLVA